ncbi:MAG: PA14 domain-containing protein, partial [Candidatus Brocadiia bacterium]
MRESHAKFVLLALIVVAVFAAWQAPALGYTDLTGDYAWKPLKIGGGGWDVGMWVHPDTPDVVYCRCDVGGAYRWDEAADTWTNVVTADSMPDEAYITYAGVDSIVGAPSDANIAYMAYCRKWWGGAAGDVYRSTNRGDTWTKPGTLGVLMDPNAGGRQEGERLAVDPADADVVYFGSTEDGLWVTTDGAATWSQVSQVPLGGSGHGVNTVVFDPNSGTTGGKTNTVYVTTWGAGVWATTDAGATWSKINGGGPADSLAPHDADIGPDGTYYVCYEESAVWKYSQGSWTNITPGGDPKAWHDVAVDPFDAQRLFITTSAAGSHWRSTDQGASWTELGKSSTSEIDWQDTYRGWSSWMGVGEILFDPHTPDTLWFAESMGVYRTTDINDGSITWQSVSRGLEDTCPNAVACPSGGHPVTAMWDIGVFYHYDPDAYTAKQAQVIHSHGWSLDYCAGQPSFVAAVSQVPDYNVSGYSTDYGETWTSFGATPADHQYVPRGIAVSATDPDNLVWWNSTDNKVWYSTDRGQSWSQGSGFPGQPHDSGWGWGDRQLDSDKVDGGTFYIYNWGSTTDPAYDGGVWRSTDGGATWSRVSTALPEGCEGPIVATPGKAGHVWFCGGLWGQDPLYRSTDHGATWSPVSGTSYATAVGFGKAGGDYPTIYMAGQVDGVHGIWRSTDEGASWARICEYPLGLYTKIKCMDGDPEAFGKLYLGLEGKGFAYGEQTTGDTTPPAAPTGLTATAASESQVNLNWDDNTEGDLDSYNVYRDGSQIATGVASSSYSDTGLSPSTQYCYTVTAVDTSSNESTESAQDCATTLAPGGGDGLTGDYYDNMDFTSHALTRVDPTVNFDWGSGSPDASMGADTFSVRWTGQVEPLYSETYTFTTRSDDGVRLWVNGQSVIDNWTDHGPTYDSGTIALSAGTKYD